MNSHTSCKETTSLSSEFFETLRLHVVIEMPTPAALDHDRDGWWPVFDLSCHGTAEA